MDFSKILLLVALTLLFIVNDSTPFLVADCVWDEALSGAPISDIRGFVLSDADACALFCSKPGGVGVGVGGGGAVTPNTQSGMSPSNVALCDRCCKSSQPPSKPGELLVSILHTLIKAFGPSKDTPSQTISTDAGPAGNAAPPAPPVPKPSAPQKPSTDVPDPVDMGPPFDPGDTAPSIDLNDEDRRARPAKYVDHFDDRNFEPAGPSSAEPRRSRAYPTARIYEISERHNDHVFSDGFDHATDRGPGWPHPASDFPLKSGTIR